MSLFKPITINTLFGLGDIETLDKFRQDFPHLYLPDNADLIMSVDIFAKISKRLICQHWIAADAFQYLDALQLETREKHDELLDIVRYQFGELSHPPKPKSRIDPEFELVKDMWQRDDWEDYGHEQAHTYLAMVIDLANDTTANFKREISANAFVGLRRTVLLGLKELKKSIKNNKNSKSILDKYGNLEWKQPERYEKEAEYVFLLREFEDTFPPFNTVRFRKRLNELKELNDLRNNLEHEIDPNGDYSAEKLIKCFEVVKELFTAFEQHSEIRERANGHIVLHY